MHRTLSDLQKWTIDYLLEAAHCEQTTDGRARIDLPQAFSNVSLTEVVAERAHKRKVSGARSERLAAALHPPTAWSAAHGRPLVPAMLRHK